MRFGTAIERLVDYYRTAKGKVWIRDDVAWALYQTWKEADRKTEPQTMYYPQVDGITPSVIEPQFDKDINVRSKTENCSEIPNNCKPQTDTHDIRTDTHECVRNNLAHGYSVFNADICHFEQTETSTNSEKLQSGVELKTDCAWK